MKLALDVLTAVAVVSVIVALLPLFVVLYVRFVHWLWKKAGL